MHEDKDFAEKDALRDRKGGIKKLGFKKKVCKFCQGAASTGKSREPGSLHIFHSRRSKRAYA